MAKARKPKQYTPQYRREAAILAMNSNRSQLEVAEEIGVGSQLLGRWVREEKARQDAEKTAADEPLTFNERMELAKLREENAGLRNDVEFLKKAAAFFASGKKR